MAPGAENGAVGLAVLDARGRRGGNPEAPIPALKNSESGPPNFGTSFIIGAGGRIEGGAGGCPAVGVPGAVGGTGPPPPAP